jgi:hypothetical protein
MATQSVIDSLWMTQTLTSESMSLVHHTCDRYFVGRYIILKTLEDGRSICVILASTKSIDIGVAVNLFLGQKGSRCATLAFAASSLWHCHLQEQVVSRDCRREQTLSEWVVWSE